MALSLTAIGLGLGVLGKTGSIISANQSGSPSFTSADRGLIRRPFELGPIEERLLAEEAIRLGASPQEVGIQLLGQRIGAGRRGGADQRIFQQRVNQINSLLEQGDTVGAQRAVDRLNRRFVGRPGKKPFSGGGQLSIQNGQLSANLGGELGSFLTQIQTSGQAGQIAANRLLGVQNLSALAADFPVSTEQRLLGEEARQREVLESQIADRFRTQQEQLLAAANAARVSPSAGLGLLGREQALQRQSAGVDALSRAIQTLSGRQQLGAGSIAGINAALNPNQAANIAQLFGQRQASGFDVATQQGTALSTAKAQADFARQASVTSLLGELGLLGFGSVLGGGRSGGPAASNGGEGGSLGGGASTSNLALLARGLFSGGGG